MPGQPKKKKDEAEKVTLIIPDNLAMGIYANYATIMHSESEFIIDHHRMIPNTLTSHLAQRILCTPIHAKILLEALAANIKTFEAKFGVIEISDEKIPAIMKSKDIPQA